MSSQHICIASMWFCSSLHGCLASFVLRYIFSIYCPFFLSLFIVKQFLPQPQKLTKNTKISYNIPALDTTATPATDMVIALLCKSGVALLRTEPLVVAERFLRRPDTLERLVKKHLKTLNGPQHVELIAQVSEQT